MKTKSREGYDVPFKSILVFWDIPENDFKKDEISAWYESGRYYVILKSIFALWYILEHDFYKTWNFCLLWKLHQAGDIKLLLISFFLSETFWNII